MTQSPITACLNPDAPIGVFDSGLGGLSVFTHIYKQLPFENYIYLADTLHVPYGSRQADDIQKLTLQAVDWLVKQGCKLVVIACNTASAHGLPAVRQAYPNLPIVGLVPALKPAVLHTQTKQVAVLATPATLHGYLLNDVIDEVANPQGVTVYKYSIASLVPWVEEGMPTEHVAVQALDDLMAELFVKRVDQLVLGCTHFPFFKGYLIEKLQNHYQQGQQQGVQLQGLQLIDSGQAIAKRVHTLLERLTIVNHSSQSSALNFYHTGNFIATEQVAQRLLGQFLPQLSVNFWQNAYDGL
ncbi:MULTISPECIES: glutamate racemase [unclassified Moraxella]|uniref:glutamate racemase n=1 Tax=unclassified Moraxella TaxID=2685852 RepID=UPI003AF943C2